MTARATTESEAQPVGKHGEPAVLLSRTVDAPIGRVWEVLVSPAGAAALLGEGALLGAKGEPYHCTDGTAGVLRSYHPLEQLRVSWHRTPADPATVVEVDLAADGARTVLLLRHDHLPPTADVEALQARWTAALAAVDAAVTAAVAAAVTGAVRG